MKKILYIFALSLTSCGTYVQLDKEAVGIINRGSDITKINAKIEKGLSLQLINTDTIVSSINDGICKFEHIKRSVVDIPSNEKVKITELTGDNLHIEYLKYNLSFTMIPTKSGYIIDCNRQGVINGTNYIVSDKNVNLLVRMKNISSKQSINLKKK